MSKYERLKQHLPSLYRPEERDLNLLNGLLKELGTNMDEVSRDLTNVMQSHWYKVADKASYDPHYLRGRELQGMGPINIHDAADKKDIAEYPYLLDLARLGSLVSVPPWREPLALRENVEQYRTRLLRIIQIYRNGLGTLGAIRAMTTAELPENADLALNAQQRSFVIEENTPYIGQAKDIVSVGASLGDPSLEEEILGPLMRWHLSNNGMVAVAPVIFITGIAATEKHDATVTPAVERFDPTSALDDDQSLSGIGIAYNGTLAANETLKLAPAHGAILAGAAGIQRSANSDTQIGIQAYQAIPGAPAGTVTASLQTTDKVVWFAIDNAGAIELWRYDGNAWQQVLTSETLTSIHCLRQRQQELLIGCEAGLFAVELFPTADFSVTDIAAYSGNPVYAIELSETHLNHCYIGSANGMHRLDPSNTISETVLEGAAIRAICENSTSIFFGGDLGVFQYRFRTQELTYLHAQYESEQESDWLSFEASEVPVDPEFGLPSVQSLCLGDDDILWIGTSQGFARYRARKEADLVYRTVLEAFSDLVDGAVNSIQQDDHGIIWIATDNGLLRFDGRDLAVFDFADNVWQQLGEADSLYSADQKQSRSVWRFNRSLSQWETFDYIAKQWVAYSGTASLSSDSIQQCLLIDTVHAALGTLNGHEFTFSSDVPESQLLMRCKPDHLRIVGGGIPCVPRMPQGTSNWRYLSLEPESLVDSTDLPWWSMEGRLVPPPVHDAPYPGRFQDLDLTPFQLDQMVFAYNPAAKVKFQWENNKPLRVLVRLLKRNSDDVIDPAIVDRVWHGVNKVKPAGVNIRLAVDETIVRGEQV
ncbi:MAG: hypothetical protein MI867_28485 [Pseudomonadales bacterium]|nr:hypothetical protein [Pseudomonadales bacterium]